MNATPTVALVTEPELVDLAEEVTDAEALAVVFACPLLTALYEDGQAAAAVSWAWERLQAQR